MRRVTGHLELIRRTQATDFNRSVGMALRSVMKGQQISSGRAFKPLQESMDRISAMVRGNLFESLTEVNRLSEQVGRLVSGQVDVGLSSIIAGFEATVVLPDSLDELQRFAERALAQAEQAAAEDHVEASDPREPLTAQGVGAQVATYAGLFALVRGSDLRDHREALLNLLLAVVLFCALQLVDDTRALRRDDL